MPGLFRAVARTAVIAGTATTVSNRVSRRQARRWGQEEQPAEQEPAQQEPPPPPAAPPVDPIARLKDLADLKAQGVLTDDEFAVQKARILNA